MISYLNGISPGNDNFWIEATDLASEGQWNFGLHSTRVSWINWLWGEPNNSNNNEDCVEIVGNRGYKWNDEDCLSSNRALCEKWTN